MTLLSNGEYLGLGRQIARLLGRKGAGESASAGHAATGLPGESAPDDERERLRRALRESSGDKRLAAAALGMSYRTLLRRVEEYDLKGYPRYRE